MKVHLKLASLTAFTVFTVIGNLSLSYAASCEAVLKPRYKCTAVFDNGGKVDYCVRADAFAPGDGKFLLIADETYHAQCTCEAKGTSPKFGAAKDFFCSENLTHTTSIGTVTGTTIKGQTHNTSVAIRSVFTCEAVATCP